MAHGACYNAQKLTNSRHLPAAAASAFALASLLIHSLYALICSSQYTASP